MQEHLNPVRGEISVTNKAESAYRLNKGHRFTTAKFLTFLSLMQKIRSERTDRAPRNLLSVN